MNLIIGSRIFRQRCWFSGSRLPSFRSWVKETSTDVNKVHISFDVLNQESLKLFNRQFMRGDTIKSMTNSSIISLPYLFKIPAQPPPKILKNPINSLSKYAQHSYQFFGQMINILWMVMSQYAQQSHQFIGETLNIQNAIHKGSIPL